jgi:hypothetical protein
VKLVAGRPDLNLLSFRVGEPDYSGDKMLWFKKELLSSTKVHLCARV